MIQYSVIANSVIPGAAEPMMAQPKGLEYDMALRDVDIPRLE
ncbi:MAG: hypothetical protein Roseis3KO_54140 [Roseivirga sp.]